MMQHNTEVLVGGLLKLAEKITKQHNLYGIAVIAGDGVRRILSRKTWI